MAGRKRRIEFDYSEIDQMTQNRLDRLEEQIKALYAKTAESYKDDVERYFNELEEKAKAKREQVDKGEITEEAYKLWLRTELYSDKRWQQLKERIIAAQIEAKRKAVQMINETTAEVYVENANYEQYLMEQATGRKLGDILTAEDIDE